VISINKLPMPSNLTNSLGTQAMHLLEKPSAEKNARKLTRLQTLGGTRLRRTSEVILTWRSKPCLTITHLTTSGRFRQAADREKEIAQIYQHELNNIRSACESLERAGDWYSQEDATATANACYKDAADLHAELEEYPQAIQRYEQVADQSLVSALTKYSVKEYWLKACLCALAMKDSVTAKRNTQKYMSQDPTFASTRECKFVNAIIDAIQAEDQQAFTGCVVEYDQVTKLDSWKTMILLKVKHTIEGEPTIL